MFSHSSKHSCCFEDKTKTHSVKVQPDSGFDQSDIKAFWAACPPGQQRRTQLRPTMPSRGPCREGPGLSWCLPHCGGTKSNDCLPHEGWPLCATWRIIVTNLIWYIVSSVSTNSQFDLGLYIDKPVLHMNMLSCELFYSSSGCMCTSSCWNIILCPFVQVFHSV